MVKCSKLSFDKRTGEPYCRSTHVCYKSVCLDASGDFFTSSLYHCGAYILNEDEKKNFKHIGSL